jgi:hypothetical protein
LGGRRVIAGRIERIKRMTDGGRRVGVVDSVVGLNVRTFVELRG